MSTYGTSIRFDEKAMERLRSVSEASGIKIAKLVRLATDSFLDEVESRGSIEVTFKTLPSNKKKK